jgi:small-conductance mechanosensitive channel/CRP-like cAMP-binding protein
MTIPTWFSIAGPPAMLGLTVCALLLIRRRSARDRLIVETLLLVALVGCFMVWGISPLHANLDMARRDGAVWLRTLEVVWWLMGARIAATTTVLALGRDAQSRKARLVSDLVAAAIYGTAALVVMTTVLGLQIKGLLATSGVIAIVLGLASQSTLSDVFSGIAVTIDKPFRAGDRVSIGDQEGVIVQINWRSIRLQTDGEDIAMIPNSIVARSLVINRSNPTPRRAASVEIATQSTLRSEVLLELLRQAALLSPALLTEPVASASLKHLGARTTTFSVSFFVATSADLSSARSQLLRQIRRLFRHAGVSGEAPISTRDLLTALPLFASLTPDQIRRLEQRLIPRSLEAGRYLYEQGAHGASMYIVRSGVVEISREAHGSTGAVAGFSDRAFRRMGPGECLGEISVMSGKPHPVSVRALTLCEILELPSQELKVLVGEDAALSRALDLAVSQSVAVLDRNDAGPPIHPPEVSPTLMNQIRHLLRRRPDGVDHLS